MNTKLRKRLAFCLAGVASITLVSLLVAWSSKSFPPPFQAVHQKAIVAVLSSQVVKTDLDILQAQQQSVDKDQQPFQSYEHAMTGLMKAGDTTNTQTPIFIEFAETYVRTNLAAAIQARHAASNGLAMLCLGRALHPLEDAASPAHEPFQPWKYDESLGEMLHHIWIERSYPDDKNDPNQVAQLTRLKGAVQYAYDIYMEKITNIPARFFDPTNGRLVLPPTYTQPGK